jgi:hypothetical protein
VHALLPMIDLGGRVCRIKATVKPKLLRGSRRWLIPRAMHRSKRTRAIVNVTRLPGCCCERQRRRSSPRLDRMPAGATPVRLLMMSSKTRPIQLISVLTALRVFWQRLLTVDAGQSPHPRRCFALRWLGSAKGETLMSGTWILGRGERWSNALCSNEATAVTGRVAFDRSYQRLAPTDHRGRVCRIGYGLCHSDLEPNERFLCGPKRVHRQRRHSQCALACEGSRC